MSTPAGQGDAVSEALAIVGPFDSDGDFMDENDAGEEIETPTISHAGHDAASESQLFLHQSQNTVNATPHMQPVHATRVAPSSSSSSGRLSPDGRDTRLGTERSDAVPRAMDEIPVATPNLQFGVGPLSSLQSPLRASRSEPAVAFSPIQRARNHFDCFGEMLENSFLSDVRLRTSDGHVIPAHKIVLAAVSLTFRTMFSEESHCASDVHSMDGERVIPTIDVPYSYDVGGFKLVLQYMYTGSIVGFDPMMAVSLLEASSYFQLDELKSLAVQALCSSTTEENVFDRLDLALSYNCSALKEHSLMIIRQYNTEVIHSRDWLSLPLDVALLLIQETVIEGELTILQRCFEWCKANAPNRVEETLIKFLKFVDFTAMTEAEVATVESMKCVPVSILYDAFKRSVLGLPTSHVPRNGGIVLQWEMKADQQDVEVVNNHVTKISSDYIPRTVCAINKFSRGRHYWTVHVMDLRLPHDSFVGVMYRPSGMRIGGTGHSPSSSPFSPTTDSCFSNSSEPISFVFEPCCMSVKVPEGCIVVKEPAANPSILIERWCEVGVLLDFTEACIKWYNHRTKALLFTVKCPNNSPLPTPMYPCVTLIHKSNGGAMLSESTTFQSQRPPKGFTGPVSVTPIKSGRNASAVSSSAILAAGGSPSPSSHIASRSYGGAQGAGLASVPPISGRARMCWLHPPNRRAGGLTASDDFPIANTKYGQIKGITELGSIKAFRAIPFAEPPVGALRFGPTVGLQKGWNGVLDGTKPSAGCMATCSPSVYPRPSYQCAASISEDCLYLNIFTPTLNASASLPVMVWFHGGNFMFGAGGLPMYDGSDLVKTQNMVVVTTNYRLGVFGGLYTGNVKGNFQILDQRQALIFISEVIESFGGDKNQVTISGQSAGAASVATHLVTPKSWPYFGKAIMMSNPSTMPAASRDYALHVGNVTLQLLGCGTVGSSSTAKELACLRAISSDDLLNATAFVSLDTKNLLEVNLRWGPVVDGDELKASPFDIITGSPLLPNTKKPFSIHSVPILMGTTQDEAMQFVHMAFSKPASLTVATIAMDLLFGAANTKQIFSLYGTPSDTNDVRPFLSTVLTDYLFYCSNRLIAGGLSGALPTANYTPVPALFYYHYNHQASWTSWLYDTIPECITAVCHAEDVPALFNSFFSPYGPADMPKPTADEARMILDIQMMWGGFVRSGTPGVVPMDVNASFPPFSFSDTNVVELAVKFRYLDGYHQHYCDFWDSLGYNESDVHVKQCRLFAIDKNAAFMSLLTLSLETSIDSTWKRI